MARALVIGSRGSKLALWQAEQARESLQLLNPGIDIKIEIIKTTGDVKSEPLSVIGASLLRVSTSPMTRKRETASDSAAYFAAVQ